MVDTLPPDQPTHKSKLAPVIGAVVIVLLATAGGVGLRWWQLDNAAKKAAQPSAVQKKVTSVQDAALSGDYTQAQQDLAKALDNKHLSASERYSLLYQQGVTYENQHEYTQAIKSYQQAEAIQPTQSVSEAIARTAAEAGNKDLAISYYKKAITRIPADRPVGESDKERYEQLIKNLGGQP